MSLQNPFFDTTLSVGFVSNYVCYLELCLILHELHRKVSGTVVQMLALLPHSGVCFLWLLGVSPI